MSRQHIKLFTSTFSLKPFSPLDSSFFQLAVGHEHISNLFDWITKQLGRLRIYHVEMACFAVLRIQLSYRSGNPKTPVTRLGDIFTVPKFYHELIESFRILSHCKSSLFNTGAKSEIWERWGDDVETGVRGRCGGGGALQVGKNFEDLEKGARP